MGMRFGMWNVRSLYRAGSLMTAAKEISKYKLDLVGMHEVRRDRGANNQKANIHSTERGIRITN
jgi:hypothetical protein